MGTRGLLQRGFELLAEFAAHDHSLQRPAAIIAGPAELGRVG
jgi:hypothetical protein